MLQNFLTCHALMVCEMGNEREEESHRVAVVDVYIQDTKKEKDGKDIVVVVLLLEEEACRNDHYSKNVANTNMHFDCKSYTKNVSERHDKLEEVVEEHD